MEAFCRSWVLTSCIIRTVVCVAAQTTVRSYVRAAALLTQRAEGSSTPDPKGRGQQHFQPEGQRAAALPAQRAESSSTSSPKGQDCCKESVNEPVRARTAGELVFKVFKHVFTSDYYLCKNTIISEIPILAVKCGRDTYVG